MIHRIRNTAGYTNVDFLEQIYRPELVREIGTSLKQVASLYQRFGKITDESD